MTDYATNTVISAPVEKHREQYADFHGICFDMDEGFFVHPDPNDIIATLPYLDSGSVGEWTDV